MGPKLALFFRPARVTMRRVFQRRLAGDGVTQFGYNTEWLMADADRPEEESELRRFLARIRDGDEDAARELLRLYEAKVRLVVRRQLPRLLRVAIRFARLRPEHLGEFFPADQGQPHRARGDGEPDRVSGPGRAQQGDR